MQQYFQIHGASLSYLVFAVIEEITPNDLCMGQNLDVSALFVLQSLAIALVGEEQAHPVAFVTHRGIVGQDMEDNHVPGVFIKPGQVHVVMPLVVLGTCLNPGFFHPLGNGFDVWHFDFPFSRYPGMKKAAQNEPPKSLFACMV